MKDDVRAMHFHSALYFGFGFVVFTEGGEPNEVLVRLSDESSLFPAHEH